jgi:ATP-dependent DNA helicase RecG
VLPEWQDDAWLRQQNGRLRRRCRRCIIRRPGAVAPETPAWSRLAYDELLAGQLALALVRANQKRLAGRPSTRRRTARAEDHRGAALLAHASQARAVEEINADLGKPERMLRLLQGDVGSGKTVVALLAAATVIEAGRQAALMAPTEILARQHHKTMAPLAEGRAARRDPDRPRTRQGARRDPRAARAGELDLLVGTHALFQDEVAFRDLALADRRRAASLRRAPAPRAARKGEAVDVLVLTATPIPRTLVLTYFGDMDVSQLREKPGRTPADRHARGAARRINDVVAAVGRALERGERVYWVCPLVAESEVSDLAAAEQRFADLKQHFGDAVRSRARQAEGRREGRRDGALSPPARRACWSPPR